VLSRRRQECIDLGAGQKRNRRAVVALTGDRQDALDQAAVAWCPQRRVVEKRMNRREADIAAAGAGAPLVLEIIEKRADHWRVEIVQR
jgi:1,6-anhydro-N-acetylmuramate kinase